MVVKHTQGQNMQYTTHASRRMNQRGINEQMIEALWDFGRMEYTQGALYVVAGKKETDAALKAGYKVSINGLQMVVVDDELVVTIFRNKKTFVKLNNNKAWK